MKTINLYEDENVLKKEVSERFDNYVDEIKEKVDGLKDKVSSFVEFASNYADNDLSKQLLTARLYGDAILEMLDELDKKADEIEKENEVSNVI